MNTREQILKLLEQKGPADAKSIAEAIGLKRSGTQQLMRRMVADGELETLPLAPRTYTITKREKRSRSRMKKQTSPSADIASAGEVNPTVCTG